MGQDNKEKLELAQLAGECTEEGIQLLREGKLRKAEKMLSRAKNIYERIGDRRQVATALNLLSIVYNELGNTTIELEYLLDALDIAEEDGAYNVTAKVYNNIGSKFMYLRSFDNALIYMQKSMESFEKACAENKISEEERHSFGLIFNMNLAIIHCIKEDYKQALEYYDKAKLEAAHPLNAEYDFAFKSFEGLILWNTGNKEKSKTLLDSILESARNTEYTTDYIEVMSDLLRYLKVMKDFEHWESILDLMETRLQDEENSHMRFELLKYRLEFYEESGNTEKYKETCVKFYELYKEKEIADYANSAEVVELKTEMRRAAKQKAATDAIVYLDPLTGIANRNKMLEDSVLYIKESIEKHENIAVGLLDIDFFKECNDTYGHIDGDECIRKVAGIINEAVGDAGNVYRYGGDEFLLLLPGATKEKILEIGKCIKEKLEAAAIPNVKSPIAPYVTISQGYTRAIAETGDNIDTLVNLADRVLYSVKRCGRNDYKYMNYLEVVAGIR